MMRLLHFARACVSALIFACAGGGFLLGGLTRALVRRQEFLTKEIERRKGA